MARDGIYFNSEVPELHDIPNITEVSDAIINDEEIITGFAELMTATISTDTLTLVPIVRDITKTNSVKRKTTYGGMTFLFIAPSTHSDGDVKKVVIKELGDVTHVISGDTSMVLGEISGIMFDDKGSTSMITYHVSTKSQTIKDLISSKIENNGGAGYTTGAEIKAKIEACPHHVGDILMTTDGGNPATRWVGTTWEKIEGRFLIGANSTYPVTHTGGATTVTLNTTHLPRHHHSWSGTTTSTGNHNHSARHRHHLDNHTHSIGNHRHLMQDVPFAGQLYLSGNNSGWSGGGGFRFGGDFHKQTSQVTGYAGAGSTGGSSPYTDYQNAYTNITGNHSHTVSGNTSDVGSSGAFNIINPYYSVYIWRRTK